VFTQRSKVEVGYKDPWLKYSGHVMWKLYIRLRFLRLTIACRLD
jgi:hypothetical protein